MKLSTRRYNPTYESYEDLRRKLNDSRNEVLRLRRMQSEASNRANALRIENDRLRSIIDSDKIVDVS